MVGHFPLEGDGCVPALFHYIWNKNPQKKSCPLVNVPDTVVYKYRQPAYWYFTSKDPMGGVKMKNKTNLGNVKVEEVLCNKPAGSNNEVVAYYISSEELPGQGVVTTIEHFDAHGLKDFLMNHEKENNGILQRFIDSKGRGNALFRAIWSPSIFHVERRQNLADMHDKKINLHQRVVTFEGGEHYSESLTVTDTLLGAQMQRVCESIVDHCSFHLRAQGDNARINRMVLHFKVDDNNRIWFLWCSSIRLCAEDPNGTKLRDTTPMDISTKLTVPEGIRRYLVPRNYSEHGPRASAIAKKAEFVCGPCYIVHGDKCARVVDMSRKCEVTYKMVLEYWEEHKADIARDPEEVPWLANTSEQLQVTVEELPGLSGAEGQMESVSSPSSQWQSGASAEQNETLEYMSVPPVFRKLHPNMTPANFALLRKDPLFLYSRMAVCDVCFLLFTDSHAPLLPIMDKMPSSLLMERKEKGSRETLSRTTVDGGASTPGLTQSRFSRSNDRSKSSTPTGMVTKPSTIPPLETSNPMSMGGYHYVGNALASKAPRKSTRVAENYVASVATNQFTNKVLQRPMPLQYTPTPEPMDFAGAMSMNKSSMAPDTSNTFALSVLEGEEAFLRSLQAQGARREMGEGVTDSYITRRAVSNVTKKLKSTKEKRAADPAALAEGQDTVAPLDAGEELVVDRGMSVDRDVVAGGKFGTENRRKGKHWLDSSPLLPGGASALAKGTKKKPGDLSMYLLPGTGSAAAKRKLPGAVSTDESTLALSAPGPIPEGLSDGVIAAIELAKQVQSAKGGNFQSLRKEKEKQKDDAEERAREQEMREAQRRMVERMAKEKEDSITAAPAAPAPAPADDTRAAPADDTSAAADGSGADSAAAAPAVPDTTGAESSDNAAETTTKGEHGHDDGEKDEMAATGKGEADSKGNTAEESEEKGDDSTVGGEGRGEGLPSLQEGESEVSEVQQGAGQESLESEKDDFDAAVDEAEGAVGAEAPRTELSVLSEGDEEASFNKDSSIHKGESLEGRDASLVGESPSQDGGSPIAAVRDETVHGVDASVDGGGGMSVEDDVHQEEGAEGGGSPPRGAELSEGTHDVQSTLEDMSKITEGVNEGNVIESSIEEEREDESLISTTGAGGFNAGDISAEPVREGSLDASLEKTAGSELQDLAAEYWRDKEAEKEEEQRMRDDEEEE